jgi:putative transcriptional regulator
VAPMDDPDHSGGQRRKALQKKIRAKLGEQRARVEAKVDEQRARIDAKIDQQRARIEAKIDAKIDAQRARLDAQRAKLDAKLSELDAKLDAKLDEHRAKKQASRVAKRAAARELLDKLSTGIEAIADKRKLKKTLRTHDFEYKPAPVLTPSDLVRIRTKLNLSRALFAACLRTNLRTLENWEQGRAYPNEQAVLLISLVRKFPDTVQRLAAI